MLIRTRQSAAGPGSPRVSGHQGPAPRQPKAANPSGRSRLLALLTLLGGLGGLLLSVLPAAAHGARVEYQRAPGIVIEARYDGGQPMAGADIIVYAPDNPTAPRYTGTSDQHGRFSFVPDPTLVGTWTVQARQAGHGAMAHIELAATDGPLQDAAPIPTTGPPTTTGQRWLMAGAVIWGFIGTALFFRRRPTN